MKLCERRKPKPSGKHFQHAFGEQHAGALGILLQDVENDLVLAHRAEILHAQIARHLVQLGHRHRLQLGDVQRGGDAVALFAVARIRPGRGRRHIRLNGLRRRLQRIGLGSTVAGAAARRAQASTASGGIAAGAFTFGARGFLVMAFDIKWFG